MFCSFLHKKCTELGLITHIATPTSLDIPSRIVHLSTSASSSSPSSLSFDQLLLSAGPWSASLARTLHLPIPPIYNLPGHSILIRPSKSQTDSFDPCSECESVFAGLTGKSIGIEAADAEASTGGGEKRGGYTRSIEFVTR